MVKYDDINVGDLVLFREEGYGILALGKVIKQNERSFTTIKLSQDIDFELFTSDKDKSKSINWQIVRKVEMKKGSRNEH